MIPKPTYIRKDCERGYPVSALGVGGNGLKKKITLKWPSGLVGPGDLQKKQQQKKPKNPTQYIDITFIIY